MKEHRVPRTYAIRSQPYPPTYFAPPYLSHGHVQSTLPHYPGNRVWRDRMHYYDREIPSQPLPHEGGPERLSERAPKTEIIDWSSLYPEEVILHGDRTKKIIALTFDDGPDDEWTPQVLDVLKRLGLRATFMCVGQRIRQNPQVLKRIFREGHIVGNHSFTHPNLTKLDPIKVRSQLAETSSLIYQIGGVHPRFVRPPYGALDQSVIEEMEEMDLKIVMWDVDSLDWTQITSQQVTANVLAHAEAGSIILFHCAGGVGERLDDTVDALPRIVRKLAKEGYRFVTVPELLHIPGYQSK